jgi:hypothetical protein
MKLITITILILLISLFGCTQTTQPNQTTLTNLDETIYADTNQITNIYSGTCPKGLENDPYPGVCSQYIDTTNDGICDRSQ